MIRKNILSALSISLVCLVPAQGQSYDYADGPLILIGVVIVLILLGISIYAFLFKGLRLFSIRNLRIRQELKIRIKKGDQCLIIQIQNQSREAEEVFAPTLYFTRGSSIRKMQPKDKFSTYPLILQPGNSHSFKIEPKKMKKADKTLKKIWYFHVVVYSASQKRFKSREHRF